MAFTDRRAKRNRSIIQPLRIKSLGVVAFDDVVELRDGAGLIQTCGLQKQLPCGIPVGADSNKQRRGERQHSPQRGSGVRGRGGGEDNHAVRRTGHCIADESKLNR